ncbi:MAG: DNA repair protein rad50 [Sclerophora amabilis]|nr:MAG: DNA repair protein rad50 [Sclerophora amabilis]
MVATRSLQLTVKKTTRTQKTLEGQLLMTKNGERTAISSRVAELDQIMPQYLGVSSAILDYVIFCHQDDSLWPMSEPGVLKKKFDEIFEALKYTKAIENIKILRKKQNEELGKYKLLEQQYKIDKDRADRAERQSKELSAEIETLRVDCQNLTNEINKVTKESDKLWAQASEFEQIIGTLNGKRIEAQAKKESIDDLRQHVKQIDGSDDALTSKLENYEQDMSGLQDQIDSHLEQYETLRDDIEHTRAQLGEKQTEAGKYEAEKSQYERQVARREVMIKETAQRHNVRGFDSQLDDARKQEFMGRISKMSRDQNLNLDRVRRETRDDLQIAQSALNELGEKRSALTQGKDFAKQEIASNDKKAGGFQSDLDSIEADEGGKAALVSSLDDVVTRLRKAKTDYETTAWDDKIHQASTQLRTTEDESETLNNELIQSTRQAGDLARLKFLQKELRDRQRSLETMRDAHGERISEVLGPDWSPTRLEKDFQAVIEERKGLVAEVERQRDGSSRELERLDFRLGTARESLTSKQREQQDCAKRIRDVIDDDPEEYPDHLRQIESNRDIRKGDVDNFTHLRNFYRDCVKTASDNSVCRLCERPFKSEKESGRFLTKLDKLLSKMGQQEVADELKELEQDLRNAKAVASRYDNYQRLGSEIPSLEEEVKKMDKQRNALLGQIEDQDRIVSDRDAAKKEVDSLAKTVQNISKYSGDIKSFEHQIAEISESQQDVGSSRSLEDVQEQLSNLAEKTRALKSNITRLTSDKDRGRTHINNLELELRDIRAKLTDASHQLEKKASLETRIEEFRALNQEQRETIKRVERDIESLAPQVSRAQTKYDDISRRGVEKEKELQQEASKLSDSLNQLKVAEEEVNAYVDKGGPNQLARCQREVQNIQEEVTRLEGEAKQLNIGINQAREQITGTEDEKRKISDNLRYRRDMRALESVKAEIIELEAKNAEVDRERFVAEADKMGQRHRKLSAEQASQMGAMKSKDDQLMRLLNDWNTDYKDAAQNFKEAHIKVETTKAAVEDLGRYGSALDKAIMKYHSLKMEEINRIVEELWKKTYRGTDVDTVLIRSDNENSKANRSYNYRVCMVKQDAEMDMRGRCSAGQKVLASIIIRLALAECFGVNCGLIALDEPTTNLDRDNIRSLAESLHDIIRARRQQSNFQLIVITHDEEFLRNMKCGDFCDHYYRVSRNERQKSIIERQSISEVL